jgi:GxxExxY protein
MPLEPVGTTMAQMTTKQPDNTPRDRRHLVCGDITREVIGAFYEVYNTLGYGFLESVSTSAMAVELTRRGLRVEREVRVAVFNKGVQVGSFRADMLVESLVVVENKATATLSSSDRDQLLNYLRRSCLEVGLLLHFGPRPSFRRVVAENSRSSDPVISSVSAPSRFPPAPVPDALGG